MFDRLEQLEDRYKELEKDLSDPALVSDQQRFQKIAKQHRDMEPAIERFREYKRVRDGIADARVMLAEDDADLKAMAQDELAGLEVRLPEIEEQLKIMLLPKDPNDDKNVVLEIRAATGGDEASLFAAEVFRMYLRYAEQHRWKVEILSETESTVGGMKDVTAPD